MSYGEQKHTIQNIIQLKNTKFLESSFFFSSTLRTKK